MPYEAVIGLEVHVQLRTETKMFCRCPNRFGDEPNTWICPVCAGLPGALPVLNGRAVELAARLCLALGCAVAPRSAFDRKHYFYPDLPKGYQITQHEAPLARGGALPFGSEGRSLGIERLHLEEDAGKLIHDSNLRGPGMDGTSVGDSLLDLNRCGVPLCEIVSRPEIRSPEEAQEALRSLQQVVRYTGAGDGNMEEGSLRCDANVSLRPEGAPSGTLRPSAGAPFGTRVEIKNLNSFRNVARALRWEIRRQGEILDVGGQVAPETRGFDAARGVTYPQRDKETSRDYRYMPEPDLPALRLDEERLGALAEELPELPWRRRERFVEQYGLSPDSATLLTRSRELARYFEEAAEAAAEEGVSSRTVAPWVQTEILRRLKERRAGLDEAPPPRTLARLAALVRSAELSWAGAREVLDQIWETGEDPAGAAARMGLAQIGDDGRLWPWIEAVLESHPGQVAQFRGGKTELLDFFVGQVMARSRGRAHPARARELLASSLDGPSGGEN